MENTNIIIKDERELLSYLESQFEQNFTTGGKWVLVIENATIEFALSLPSSLSAKNALEGIKLEKPIEDYNFNFIGCSFNEDLYIKEARIGNNGEGKDILTKNVEYKFTNCIFDNEEIKIGNTYKNLTFENCKKFTKRIYADSSELNGKIRFRNCDFNELNFNNTKFYNLADFWKCTFKEKTIFYKTDFFGNAVFSSAIFKENVLFTYSLIEKVIIFRGTTFEKGLDLSTTILTGTLSYFDVRLNNYASTNTKSGTDEYEYEISESAEIPTVNKRETFRIIKNNYERQNNHFESLELKELEMNTLLDEIKTNLKDKNNYWRNIANRVLLGLNKCSNSFGNSYIKGAVFTIFVGLLFFYLAVIQTSLFRFSFCLDKEAFSEGFKYYWQFLLPTHKFEFLRENTEYSSWYYFFDFLGRIFIGYGIYQTIQAFRKYK